MNATAIPAWLVSIAVLAGCSERGATTAPTAGVAAQPALNASITSPREFDGDGHPNVGLLFIDFSADGQLQPATEAICSGFLIAPTVFLTAAHCFVLNHVAPGTALWVSFDPVWVPAPAHVIQATGFVVDPAFNSGSRFHDLTVVFLPTGSTTATPMRLPSAGLLDQLAESNGLQGLDFVKVGYGLVPTWEGAPFSYTNTGARTTSPFQTLTPAWLFLFQNTVVTDEGGAGPGDSGGPWILGDVAVSLTSWLGGGAAGGNAVGATWRLDTPEARDFLRTHVTLP
jgi:Trypsin